MSQKGNVTKAQNLINDGELIKAKEVLDPALVHPKSANLPNTFFVKGKLAQAVFASENPAERALYSDPLGEAFAAYEKAMQLDPKGQFKKRIISSQTYSFLADDFYFQGGDLFEEGDYAGALKSFETQILIVEGDKFIGGIDTGMYYNAGVAALNADKYDVAIKYFNICAEMKYMGIAPYYQIYETQLAKGDTVAAEATLVSLPKLFPDDKSVTLQLIDLYIKSGKNDDAQKYIGEAKRDDPSNSILYFASGIIYLNEEKYDEAIAELQKSIELDPNMFDAQYGIGAAYINKAASMYKAAETIMDVNQYNTAIDKANETYTMALPYMEKALQLNPDDIYTMQNLKELYYRLGMTDKYNVINAKLEAL
jgi:tetratricopeptide (TPR) repeat protein